MRETGCLTHTNAFAQFSSQATENEGEKEERMKGDNTVFRTWTGKTRHKKFPQVDSDIILIPACALKITLVLKLHFNIDFGMSPLICMLFLHISQGIHSVHGSLKSTKIATICHSTSLNTKNADLLNLLFLILFFMTKWYLKAGLIESVLVKCWSWTSHQNSFYDQDFTIPIKRTGRSCLNYIYIFFLMMMMIMMESTVWHIPWVFWLLTGEAGKSIAFDQRWF